LNIGILIFKYKRPYDNIQVHRAGKTHIAERSGIRPPCNRFKLIDYFHTPDFRHARNRAAWKCGPYDIETRFAFFENALYVRDNMYDMRVVLGYHQLVY